MRSKPLLQAACAFLLLSFATWSTLRSCQGPRINLNPYQALGTIAAQEAASLVGDKGRLLLILPDTGPDRDPAMGALLKAFRSELKPHRNVEIEATEGVRLDPFTSMQTGGAVPPDRYLAIRSKFPEIAGIVLFLPFPPLTETELESPGKRRAKVLVVSANLPTYRDLLLSGAIDVAIVPRATTAEPRREKPASPREAFDQENEILRGKPAE